MEMAEAKLRLDHLEKNLEKLSQDVQNIYEKGCKYQMGEACSKLEAEISRIKEKGCGKAALHEIRMDQLEEKMVQYGADFKEAMTKTGAALEKNEKAMELNRIGLQKSKEKSLRTEIYMEIGRAVAWLIVVSATGLIFYWAR